MTPLPFDEDYVGRHATPKVYPRGVAYAATGRVFDLIRRGDTLVGRVAGTDWVPYRVRIRLDEASGDEPVAEAACTCPYEWEGWCKHIVGVLLAALDDPEAVDERPPLAETLATLDAAVLSAALLRLAEAHPALAEALEEEAGFPPRDAHSDEWEVDDDAW